MADRLTPDELDAIRKRHRAVGNKLDFRSEPIAQIHADRAALLRHVEALEQEVERLRTINPEATRKPYTSDPFGITVMPSDVYDSSGFAWKERAEATERKLARLVDGLDGLPRITVSASRGAVCNYKAVQAIIKEARATGEGK